MAPGITFSLSLDCGLTMVEILELRTSLPHRGQAVLKDTSDSGFSKTMCCLTQICYVEFNPAKLELRIDYRAVRMGRVAPRCNSPLRITRVALALAPAL